MNPRSENPISVSIEGAPASAVMEFPSDQTCDARGLTQYPPTDDVFVWGKF